MKPSNALLAIVLCCLILINILPASIWAQDSQNCTLIGRWTKGPCYALAFNGDLAYIGTGGGFQVFDISYSANPQPRGSVNVSAAIRSIALKGSYAFVATEISGIHVIDVADPTNPIDLGIKMDYFVHQLAIEGNILVATSGQDFTRIFDISDPVNPIKKAQYDTPGYARGIVIREKLAYIADGDSGLHIIDLNAPANPVEKGQLVTGQKAYAIDVADHYAYVANRFSGTISIIDCSNPANLVEVKRIENARQPAYIKIQGEFAYVANYANRLSIYKISDLMNPELISEFEVSGNPVFIAVKDSHAFMSNQNGGLHFLDITDPYNPAETYYLNTGGITLGIRFKGHYAYLANGSGGLVILDISDPYHPVEIAMTDSLRYALNIAMDENYAYLLAGNRGIKIVDLADPVQPVLVNEYLTPGEASDIVFKENYAYLANGSTGLRILDVSDPANPIETGFIATLGNAIAVALHGNLVGVIQDREGFHLIDISNKANPSVLASVTTPGMAKAIAMDGNTVYVADYWGLRIYDITNPAAPTEIGHFQNAYHAGDVRLHQNRVYVGDGSNGVKILDVTNKANPKEIGKFDTGWYVQDIAFDDDYIYIADGHNGIYIIRFETPTTQEFTVLSTYPTDGATSVDTSATFEITLSAPLDTTARFAQPGDSYLGLIIHSDSLTSDPDSVVISPDLKTVRIYNLHLWPDTRYVVGITGARSLDGQNLKTPYAFTFSTGSTLPTASVSGTISYPPGDPTGTMVALFKDLFTDENPAALTVVDNSSGAFTLKYVPAGTYWPVALKDGDGSGAFEPDSDLDALAIYDADSDGFADTLVVAEGATITGLDMGLSVFESITARYRFQDAVDVVTAWSEDAYAVMIASPPGIDPAGESSLWIYAFYSPAMSEFFAIAAAINYMVPFVAEDGLPVSTQALPENWIDSDVAADTAEAHGGSLFRESHPEAQVMASLGNFVFASSSANSSPPVKLFKSSWFAEPHSIQTTALNPSISAMWVFQYLTEGVEPLTILIDAITGAYIENPFVPSATTAQSNVDAANDSASTWSADAELMMVIANDVTAPAGQSWVWSFVYHSTALDSTIVMMLVEGGVAGIEPFLHTFPSATPLPDTWVDSPTAVAMAEINGGSAYRSSNENVQVGALLSRGLYAANPEQAVWMVSYTSSTSPQVDYFIDAITGAFLGSTAVDLPEVMQIPKQYALYQNAPNPFNAETAIEYQMPRAADVTINIFNQQGQKVATLVSGHQQAGSYKIIWNGMNASGQQVASGVYLYKLQARDFVAVKKMVLLQ